MKSEGVARHARAADQGVPIRGLYALTPDEPETAVLSAKVSAAIEGGAAFVQYRNKTAAAALRREQCAALRGICSERGARLIVNDHLQLALDTGADGVHLGRDDGDVAAARAALGPGRILGVSCYDSLERALDAQRQGADYVAFGSFYPSSVKPGAVRASPDLLSRARRAVSLPIVAIGGITPDNAPGLIAAGADSLAVISALFDAPDVRAAARRFAVLFGQGR